MRIAIIGDIVAEPGRKIFYHYADWLDDVADFIVVNADNAAHGFGISEKITKKLIDHGADAITLGDHAWSQRQIIHFIDDYPHLIRPMNYPDDSDTPGAGYQLFKKRINGQQKKILVSHPMGQVFMNTTLESPLGAMDNLVKKYPLGIAVNAHIVDFHAEATSEKNAMAQHLDGRVSVIAGTHTHIPTADTRALKNGTAFQTDLGMTGVYDSVIGCKSEISIQWMRAKRRIQNYDPATHGDATLSGMLVELDDNGRATRAGRISLGGDLPEIIPDWVAEPAN
jgi:hypothetical protein